MRPRHNSFCNQLRNRLQRSSRLLQGVILSLAEHRENLASLTEKLRELTGRK